jgi:hypothetical protein
VDTWITNPRSVPQSLGATFHRAAPAATSIARAVAPALRSGSQFLRTPLLPPEY